MATVYARSHPGTICRGCAGDTGDEPILVIIGHGNGSPEEPVCESCMDRILDSAGSPDTMEPEETAIGFLQHNFTGLGRWTIDPELPHTMPPA